MMFHGLLLLLAELALAAHGLVEVDLIAVELRTLDAGEAGPAADRHPARHMPVPSTIRVFRLTVIGSPSFLAVRVVNFIIIIGPIATARV